MKCKPAAASIGVLPVRFLADSPDCWSA